MTLDGYVNMEAGEKSFKWDHDVIEFCVDNLEGVDTILLGRKTAKDLIPFWDDVAANPGHADFDLGKRISEIPKKVFSNTVTDHNWSNTTIISGDFNEELKKLKVSTGGDILVYGGASFASSLIQNDMVDEYYFLRDPFCLGEGVTIFKPQKDVLTFTLVKSQSFPCGTKLCCTTRPTKVMRRDIFQAIADPTRRAIIALIAVQAMTPNAIAKNFNTTRQAVSKHLRILTECELIKQDHRGREIYYSLYAEKMQDIDKWLEQFRKIWESRFGQLESVLSSHKNQQK